MFTHDFDPILFDLGFLAVRWYSLAYILGILLGWYLGKVIFLKKFEGTDLKLDKTEFDNFITYIIISIILGGRLGYVIFYNIEYYFSNPIEIIQVWKGGMSFHGALLGIIIGTYLFSINKNYSTFLLLDIVACVSPVGIFFGRVANFINGELVGKPTDFYWGVIFPKIDNLTRHPSQLYEALFEGLILFLIMIYVFFKKNYKIGNCSFIFLIFYGVFRIFTEYFREPDIQIGYLFGLMSMGTTLSIFMILAGIVIYIKRR